jgi:N-acetyl-gamma-glutamyl-phosphate reductase
MRKVFIDGEAGTTGLGIRQRLLGMPAIKLISLKETDRKDEAARLDAMRAVDLVVLCLPDDAARRAVAMIESLGEAGPKILDASTAHRVAAGWVYGFAEFVPGQAERISAARLVANPGCYATGAIALLRPLIDAGMMTADFDVSINAVSGYSGGGKAMIAEHEHDGGPAYELYALGLAHKHVPEIMAYGGLGRRPVFVPSVGHFPQGMLVSIPLFLDRLPGRPTGKEIFDVLNARYGGSLRVRACWGAADDLDPQTLNGTDLLDIFVFANGAHDHALLVARLDNLGKGASGAAVQNIALMLGLVDPMVEEREMQHA